MPFPKQPPLAVNRQEGTGHIHPEPWRLHFENALPVFHDLVSRQNVLSACTGAYHRHEWSNDVPLTGILKKKLTIQRPAFAPRIPQVDQQK